MVQEKFKSLRWERAKALSGWVVALILGLSLLGVATVALNPTFTTTIGSGSMASPAAYTVLTDGTNWFARNGKTGAIDYSSANGTSVLNSALAGLTVGRTNPETVTVRGLLMVTTNIAVKSYTVLDLTQAMLKVSNGASMNKGILDVGVTALATNVRITGGTLDGNRANHPTFGVHGVLIGNANNVTVMGTAIQNIYAGFGVFIEGATADIHLDSLTISHTEGSAIASDISINGDNSRVYIHDVSITDYGIVNMGAAEDGIHSEGTASYFNRNWAIEGGVIDGSGTTQNASGISFGSVLGGTITGVHIANSREAGIQLLSCQNVTVSGNVVLNSGTAGIAGYNNAIKIDDTAHTPTTIHTVVSGNLVMTAPGWGAVEYGTADYTLIAANEFISTLAGGAHVIGAHSNETANLVE